VSPIRDVVAAVDFSAHSERVLACAIELARALHARLHLVHSYMDVPSQLLEHNVWIPEDGWTRIRDEDGRRLEPLRARAAAAGLEVQVHQSPNPASEAIVERARKLAAGLIVMGTRGHSGVKQALLGSVARKTLREAPCPVVVVPPG
jgi:nucleotide-binding universal stress UspA family protein